MSDCAYVCEETNKDKRFLLLYKYWRNKYLYIFRVYYSILIKSRCIHIHSSIVRAEAQISILIITRAMQCARRGRGIQNLI